MKIVSKWESRINVEQTAGARHFASQSAREQAPRKRASSPNAQTTAKPLAQPRFDPLTLLSTQIIADRVEEHNQTADLIRVHGAYQDAMNRKSGRMVQGSFYQEAS